MNLQRHRRHLKFNEETLNPKSEQSVSNDILQIFPKLRLRKILSSDKKVVEKPDISSIFLRPDFDISNSETFYSIFPLSKNDKPENQTFQHNRRLTQEKVSPYVVF